MTLSVIIVSYNVRHYLSQCLGSVERAMQGIDGEVIVVDNHSSDHSPEHVRRHHPGVRVVANMHNLGFARANNIGIRMARGRYVLLLNPDTVVGEDTLRTAVGFMEAHPGSGALGVRMLNIDGSRAMESRRGIPTPLTSFYKMSGLCRRFPNSRTLGRYYMSYLPWDSAQRIEIVSGAFCLLDRRALDRVGLLDEDFFMYGEDIDLSYRLHKAGYTNWYCPVSILHYKGESTQKSSFRYVHVFYQAMLIFFRKHYGELSLLVTLPVKAAICAKAAVAMVAMMTGKMRKSLGFRVNRWPQHTVYTFIGRAPMIAACRGIAARHGLEAQFHEGDERSLAAGHNGLHLWKDYSSNTVEMVVYDTEAYSYRAILDLMAQSPDRHRLLGLYHRQRNIIVTPNEIIE